MRIWFSGVAHAPAVGSEKPSFMDRHDTPGGMGPVTVTGTMRWLAGLALLALLAGPTPAARGGGGGGCSTAPPLTVLSAPVERVGAGADRPAAAASGADLAVGDRVLTGTDGRALITFLDGSTVTVEPASEVTVRQAQMDGREASRVGLLVTV